MGKKFKYMTEKEIKIGNKYILNEKIKTKLKSFPQRKLQMTSLMSSSKHLKEKWCQS